MTALKFYAFVLVWSLAAALDHATMSANDNTVVQNMISSFNGADNDFTVSEKNTKFFPLDKAMEYNKKMSRSDYNVIKDPEFGNRTSNYLSEWRGFPRVQDQAVDRDIELLFQEGETFEAELIGADLSKADVLALPLSWQYLLPRVFYDSLNLPGNAWAEIVNAQPMNAALLYKVALLLRDEGDEVKGLFIHHLNMPKLFREDLGYILGYRWGIDAVDDGDSDPTDDYNDYNLKTLLHLPSDVVMGLDSAIYANIDIAQLLSDKEAWLEASEQGEVLWFTKFLAESGWGKVGGSAAALEQRGHVLTGAPLDRLRNLTNTSHGGANIAAILNQTDMNPLRVQELWEGIPQEQLQWMFFGEADKLDVTQLIAFYDNSFAYLYNEKAFLDREWLASDSAAVPWASLMVVGLKHMARGAPASWQEKDLLDLGRFLVLLYPPQLDQLKANQFNAGVFTKVLSPRLTHCQRTVLYRKYLESSICTTSCPLPEVLMAAIPSQTLLRLGADGTPSSAEPLAVTFARDQASLVAASALFVPGQMHALHMVARPYLWQPATLATMLAIHPECLNDVAPHEFRTNLDLVVEAVYLAGPDTFHEMAESLQRLPRHLLMAWLEAVLEMPGSSLMDGEWWNSDVLLDRNVAEEVDADGAVSPWPASHPLRQQFGRFSSSSLPRSALPSLALAGISCHCISKVETPDSLEVLGLYRFHVESVHKLGHMPSMARKCWALKVRQFLRLKAELFGVTVATEPELLSLLSTSDIKAVGAEVLLTWGGAALAGITHPQVQHEVLMTVAHNPPHLLLHNGVGLDDVEYMAKTLLNTLLKHFDSVNLSVLTHLHNLLPFADDRILAASPEDARLYISTVLRDTCKAVCIPAPARLLLRNFIVRGYGEPEVWSALDLVQLADLLVVFSRTDLARVQPTALRRAATQLSTNTLYNERLGDVRGFTDTALYHEACSAWLGDARPQEAAEFYKAWRGLGEFYLLGSHLQVTVVEYNLQAAVARRRRQATDDEDDSSIANAGDFVKNLYVEIMKDMKKKFQTSELTDVQKQNATTVITTTQELLGNASFKVLGLDITEGMTVVDVFDVLKQYKEAGNMTEAQNEAMRDLAEDTQVRMIQGILDVFGYSAAMAAEEYGVSEAEIEAVLVRRSFDSTPAERLQEDEALAALLPATTPAPVLLTTSTTADPLLVELDLLSSFSVSPTPRPDTSLPVFVRYEPVSPPLGPQFDQLPNLNSGDLALGCDCIKAAGPAAAALSGIHIAAMDKAEVADCLDTLGKLAWPRQARKEVWQAVYTKVPGLKKGTDGAPDPSSSHPSGAHEAKKPLGREELMLLENLLPAVAEYNPGLIDLDRANIDGISLLGKSYHTSSVAGLLMQSFVNDNNVDAYNNPLTSTEVASLGQLLCGLTTSQWRDLVTPAIFRDTLTGHLARLDCSVAEPVRQHLAAMLLELYGETQAWTTSDLLSAGWVAASLSPSSLAELPPHAMEGLAPRALRHLGPGRLLALDAEQLTGLSPHAASFIKREQLLPHTSAPRRRAIRAAGGEAPEIHTMMESLEASMASQDVASTEAAAGTIMSEPEPSSAHLPTAGSLAVIVLVFVLYNI